MYSFYPLSFVADHWKFVTVLPLMLKHLNQTGIGIRFDQALCTDVHLASELETHIISHRHPKTQLKQKEWCLHFCWQSQFTVGIVNTSLMCLHLNTKHSQIQEWKSKDLKYNITKMVTQYWK